MREWQKIRLSVIALAALAIFTALSGALGYYFLMERTLAREMHQRRDELASDVMRQIEDSFAAKQQSAAALAALPEMRRLLQSGARGDPREVNTILDHFRLAVNADVCYLIDGKGRTIASTNRREKNSFVGKDYSFRPYFKDAMQGKPSIYAALGVTSFKRGFYYSHPVYGLKNGLPIGVAVIKAEVEDMDRYLNIVREGILVLSDPRGVVFLANQKEWILNILWKTDDNNIQQLRDSKQFGQGPWEERGIVMTGARTAVDSGGAVYDLQMNNFSPLPGWRLLYLHDAGEFDAKVDSQWKKATIYFIFALFSALGVATVSFFKWAHKEIGRRQEIETEREKLLLDLRGALGKIKTLSGLLPICSHCKKIRDEKGYWNQIDAYIMEHSDTEFSHGICEECLDKLYPEQAKRIRKDENEKG